MKKTFSVIMVMIMTLGLTACGGKITQEKTTGDITVSPKSDNEDSSAVSDRERSMTEKISYQEYWNGDWYGWLLVVKGNGDLEYMEKSSWDCMARIDIDDNGEGSLILWDETNVVDNPTAEMNVTVSDNGVEQGCLKSVSGQFFDGEIKDADWLVEPETTQFEHMIFISGTYRSPDDPSNSIDYEIYMKPWGMDWADVEKELPTKLPVNYDWYLEAIKAGIGMPDVIGGGDFLAPGEVPDEQMEGQGVGEDVPAKWYEYDLGNEYNAWSAVRVQWAEDFLPETADYEMFTADEGEYSANVLFSAEETVEDFELVAGDYGNSIFYCSRYYGGIFPCVLCSKIKTD